MKSFLPHSPITERSRSITLLLSEVEVLPITHYPLPITHYLFPIPYSMR
ncbi:MAG: hypothetical protein ACRC2M_17710 [Planktothrix sp.]